MRWLVLLAIVTGTALWAAQPDRRCVEWRLEIQVLRPGRLYQARKVMWPSTGRMWTHWVCSRETSSREMAYVMGGGT